MYVFIQEHYIYVSLTCILNIFIIFIRILGNLPNTYAFTKALAEGLVVEAMQTIPAIIIRPSIGKYDLHNRIFRKIYLSFITRKFNIKLRINFLLFLYESYYS